MQEKNVLGYVYNYACHEEEYALCRLEMRSLFGYESKTNKLESLCLIEPSRSPFIKGRIDIFLQANHYEELLSLIDSILVEKKTFKVVFIQEELDEKIPFQKRRMIEKEVGLRISGKVDLNNPDTMFAVAKVNNKWVFGNYLASASVWLHHQKKPKQYSTALSTRMARAIVNIAIPNTTAVKVIDPCCGIGTVLIEALSMGINIVGSDINPLAAIGARENIAYFGYKCKVALKDIRDVTGSFNCAIIDMPYNVCSVLSPEEQLEMLKSARSFTEKMVVVTVENIDEAIGQAGFHIIDRCDVKKGSFVRQILVCE